MLSRLFAATIAALSLCVEGALAAEYYVARDGSDLRGSGSAESPWGSIDYAVRQLDGGDTLTVRAGLYEGPDHFIANIPSGEPGRYTTIRAEQPMSVRIRHAGASLRYRENLAKLEGSYIRVDGFIFELADSVSPPYVVRLNGDHLKLTRSIVKRSGRMDPYGGLVAVGGSYNLIEDVAGVGVCRYCFYTGGPKDDDHRIIFRRVVGRFDYANSDQPKATFAAYGNNSGHRVREILMQNVIALDGNYLGIGRERKYGGIYAPKNTAGLRIQGGIILNEGSRYAGMFVQEQQGRDTVVEHSLVWDLRGPHKHAGVRENGSGDDRFEHLTIGGRIQGRPIYTRQGRRASDSILMPAPGSLDNLLDNGAKGARIIERYGRSGSLWGEPGFDERTDEPLWPWPYEDAIKTVFAEPNQPPEGYQPRQNDSRRGFTVATDRFGERMTLSRYIWQYLGTPAPDWLYAKEN